MSSAFSTHDVVNQSTPFVGVNLFASDPALVALLDPAPHAVAETLSQQGQFWGSQDAAELARLANENVPRLKTHEPSGARLDTIEFHPAYNALMRRSIAAGLHASLWDDLAGEGAVRSLARAARVYVTAQTEAGHLSGLITTNAVIAALAHAPRVAEAWMPAIRSRRYDPGLKPPADKAGVLVGSALTEKQAGSDLKGCSTVAQRSDDGLYRITGHKWFVSGPASDALLTVAHTQEGLSAFLVPRFLPDGRRNFIRLVRLKDKLGNRSAATAEVEFEGAGGYLIGAVGQAQSTLAEMTGYLRLDSALISAGLMRSGLAQAVHHCRQRRAFGATLIDHELMTRVLADVALDVVGATALAFRLAEAFDRREEDPTEAAFARLMAPVTKYWVTKIAPAVMVEAMECAGGNAYVEESRMPRLYRDAPAEIMAEGPGNVLGLDALKVLRRSSESLEAVLAVSENSLGPTAKTSINILRAAAAVALADEGSARTLCEQLAMTVAAASLRRSFPAVIADGFIETRLGRQWRSTYGMLDSRFDSRAFVNYVCPQT